MVRALGKPARSALHPAVVGTVFGAGSHPSCGILVGVFWCVKAAGSGKGGTEIHSRTHEKETKGILDLSRGCCICSWVAARGTRRLGVGALGGKGVPLGVLASRSEGQGQHAWLE